MNNMEQNKKYHTYTVVITPFRLAVFTESVNRLSGAKISYSVPTYSALLGIFNSIYSRPYFFWVIDECRVINRIKFAPIPRTDPFKNFGKSERYIYQYLTGCKYVVKAHFEIDKKVKEPLRYYSLSKINNAVKAEIRRGGEGGVFLGCRECQAFVHDGENEELMGYYDDFDELDLGEMFHSFSFPDSSSPYVRANSWHVVMRKGIIKFPRPRECEHRRNLYKLKRHSSTEKINNKLIGDLDEPQLFPVRNNEIPKRK